MWLDRRLRSVVDEIENASVTIDVGTDHGKVILTALSEGRTRQGIASDISPLSLKKARELANKMGYSIDTRLGDGLHVLTSHDSVDTCVIAGMGGKEIVKILSEYEGKIPRLILVPHKDARLTRRYLVSHGYGITKDYMVEEAGFFYNIIVAKVGNGSITLEEEYLGKNDVENEAFRRYIEYRKGVIADILRNTDNEELKREYDILSRVK